MAYIDINRTTIWYEIHGEGSETLFFSHGLLFSGAMFEDQVRALSDTYRCVVYDHRGQGQSGKEGPFDMDTLAEDAVELIRKLNLGPVHFAGLSMGGFVGMRVAINYPELIRSLNLIDTSADPEVFVRKYNLLVKVVQVFGVRAVAGRVMKIMFAQPFLSDQSRSNVRGRWKSWLRSLPKDITGPVRGVIDRNGVYNDLEKIHCPTQVLVGQLDVATTPDKAERLAKAIPHARLTIIPRAGHSASIEEPDMLNDLLRSFTDEVVASAVH